MTPRQCTMYIHTHLSLSSDTDAHSVNGSRKRFTANDTQSSHVITSYFSSDVFFVPMFFSSDGFFVLFRFLFPMFLFISDVSFRFRSLFLFPMFLCVSFDLFFLLYDLSLLTSRFVFVFQICFSCFRLFFLFLKFFFCFRCFCSGFFQSFC